MVITGAGGYVGGRLIGTLLDDGWETHGIVRDPTPRLMIPHIVGDLSSMDRGELTGVLAGADTVVHLAGHDEVLAAREPGVALAETVVATENVCEACAEAGVGRIVYMSTVHVYGARMGQGITLSEDMRVEPRSAYAISRLASEHVAAGLAAGGYELVIFRLTNSVGAPDDPSVNRWSLVANDLCRQGSVSGRLELRSSGMQWRDFVALRSVCGAVAAACRGELPPATYNLGSGRPMTVRALAEMIQSEFERQTGTRPPLHAPDPEPDPPDPYFVSVERAARRGVRLEDPLQDAVSETVTFCLQHREELEGPSR